MTAAGQTLPRLALVADDLTGAADAAAPFARRGAEVSLTFSEVVRADADVLALLSDSRWRAPAAAARRVGTLIGSARAWGADSLFVKVDSTLRGNVRTEVAAALRAWGNGPAIAAPAFPAQGRVVRRGVLYVHGDAQPGIVADHFPPDVEVLDAESDEELDRIAHRVLEEGAVAVGSAGLARALADATIAGASPPRVPAGPVKGVLVVVGTRHPVSRTQADRLRASGALSVALEAGTPPLLTGALGRLKAGGRVVLTTEPTDPVEADSPRAVALAAELAGVVATISRAAPEAALVLTGGATALAVARALGAREFRLLGDIRPGIAWGEFKLADRTVPAVSKSGGFGTQDALLESATILEECA